jgi:RNA polymerase sigma-70 factor (ECF subfamily)
MGTQDSVTVLMRSAAAGDAEAAASLFAIVYDELRRLAASALRHERPGHTLQPTALVHEAYLRLADEPDDRWRDRAHFFAVAALAMRRILVDHARSRNARKRTRDGMEPPQAAAPLPTEPERGVDFVLLDQALARLATLDQRQAKIVELRFFAGLSVEETAEVIGASTRTVKRDWQSARAWLRREMADLSSRS